MPRWALCLGVSLALLWSLSPPVAADHKTDKHTRQEQREKDFSKFVEIPGAERLGSDQCSTCHEEQGKTFRHSNHALQSVECEDCHGSGSLHLASDKHESILKFSKMKAEDANGACLSCHAKSDHVRNWFAGAHAAQDVRCIDCHTIHEGAKYGERMGLVASGGEVLREPRPIESRRNLNDKCMQCHKKQDAQANLPYHHPIREAKMSCSDCHDPHGGSAGNNLTASNANQLCLRCHAEYQGPFSYQHPPVNEDCMKCHSPHGSPNQNMLVVSQPALCLQCHSAHHNGSSVPLVDRCTNCHNSIHGTDVPSAVGGGLFIDK
jgi:predicted CXXCH cytochrome family protein